MRPSALQAAFAGVNNDVCQLPVTGRGSVAECCRLTSSTPTVPNCCCSKGSVPYWYNPLFLIYDIRALWRSVLSARVPECQKLTSSSAVAERPRELDQRFQMGGQFEAIIHCVRKKVTPCVLFYNSGKWCRTLTKFCMNNAASNCKQTAQFH